MIQAGIYSLLTADPGVSTIVGTRVFPPPLTEQTEMPCVLYSFVGGSSTATFATAGMQRLRMQLDCWAADYDAAAALREAVVRALNGYQGQLSDGTFLSNAFMVNPGIDFFEDDSREVRCMVEFYLLFDFQ
jgi:hypothetical protein